MKIKKFTKDSNNDNLNEGLVDKWKKLAWGDIESQWDQFKILHAMLLDIMKKLDKMD